MRVFKMICFCAAVVTFTAQAKDAYSVFSIGPAWPMSGSAAKVDTMGNTKNLSTGWNGAWTFFGYPFAKSETALSALALGGKISYGRWVRDSTYSEINFLGTQIIARYTVPPMIKPFDLFIQAGLGMFIGCHGFSDADTINTSANPSNILVTKGQTTTGASFNIGIDWDVIEVSPGITFVLTKDNSSAWFEIDAAMKF